MFAHKMLLSLLLPMPSVATSLTETPHRDHLEPPLRFPLVQYRIGPDIYSQWQQPLWDRFWENTCPTRGVHATRGTRKMLAASTGPPARCGRLGLGCRLRRVRSERDPEAERSRPAVLLLFTALIVHAFNAGRAVGTRGDAHSILGLGLSTPARSSGFHPVLIRLGDDGIARMRVISRLRTVAVLHARHPVGCLLRRRHSALIRIDGNGTLPVAANGFPNRVGDAVGRKDVRSTQH